MLVLRNDYTYICHLCVLQHCCVVSSIVEGFAELGRKYEVDSPVAESTNVCQLCVHSGSFLQEQ